MATAAARPVNLPAGPFGAVVDVSDPNTAAPTQLFDAVNMYVPDPVNGSAVLARHGLVGQTTALGSGDVRTGQGVFLHRRLDGVRDRFAFGGGRMYRWDGATTFTDITPAGIAIDSSNPIFAETFNGEVIISDETNKPWIYTPTTGAAVVIELDDLHQEWCTKGGPYIYSGCVFFILKGSGNATLLTELGDTLQTEDGFDLSTEVTSGAQNTIVWSNPLDPRTGYDQLDFDRTWQLTQTSSELLGALFASEGALIYLRSEGIGYLTGPVTEDFRGSATKDAISQTIGTDTPAAVVAVGNQCWFADLDGRIHRCSAGGGEPEPLWFPMRRQVTSNLGTSANRENVRNNARGAYHHGYDLVLFTLWDRQTIYAFSAHSGKYIGTWQVGGGIHVTAMGSLVDATNREVFIILGSRTSLYLAAGLGVMWRQKFPDDAMQWLDQADAAVATYLPFTRATETQWLLHRSAEVFRAVRLVASLVGDVVQHTVLLQYMVSGSGLSAALSALSSSVIGEKSVTDAISTARWSLGRKAQGGKMRCRLTATHADNVQFGVHDLQVDGVIVQARASAR